VCQFAFLIGLACSLAAPVLWAQEESAKPKGIGLTVEPGGLLIQHVKPGETYDLAEKSNITLKISNGASRPTTYQLTTQRPSQVGNRKWLEGYLEMPDPRWFWFEQDEITVEPESDAYVKMYLKVPYGMGDHFNQHWVVSIGVQGKAKTGEMLALAIYPRYQIETESKADIEVPPAGALGLKPSVLEFDEMPLGERKEFQLTLYNNEAENRRYRISVKTIQVDPTREQIFPTPGYTWLQELKWVSPKKKRVKIDGNQSRTVSVKVKIPEKPEYYGKSWETLLWIEPDEGPPRFARIQITTAGPEEP